MVQVDIVQLSPSALKIYDRVDMELQIPHTLFYFLSIYFRFRLLI